MEFTRQPIIETVISAKEGFKLVVRSSKGAGQEEYFVDAVEVVSFGNSFFFRSSEKPKAFLVPATDYEILEVREARMVLKNVGLDKAIKIGGGKEALMKAVREPERVQEEPAAEGAHQQDRQSDRKRDRRRGLRRRRDREERDEREELPKEGLEEALPGEEPKEEFVELTEEAQKIEIPEPKKLGRRGRQAAMELSSNVLKSLLTPPPNLISDTIEKYRDDDLFKGVFISKENEEKQEEGVPQEQAEEPMELPLSYQPTEYQMSSEEEEEIYRQRVVAKEHESENYIEGIEEGPSAVVESFTHETTLFQEQTYPLMSHYAEEPVQEPSEEETENRQ
ncbi:hypothetical protein [Estrella lausannensis]|uniref:Uncharacterized protein n=1 Tax=Estrella lausannensis TaxID=483423 RepID=A0A0H5DNG9_9BACT|nr:hypothetical protein [Estrella lausannensis]CRX37871.1 conserved hypothetical protein [Estrella lausannensis]